MNFENYSFIRDRWTRAQTSYECAGCGMLVRKGERHYVLIGKPHGWRASRIIQRRFCSVCGESMQQRQGVLDLF